MINQSLSSSTQQIARINTCEYIIFNFCFVTFSEREQQSIKSRKPSSRYTWYTDSYLDLDSGQELMWQIIFKNSNFGQNYTIFFLNLWKLCQCLRRSLQPSIELFKTWNFGPVGFSSLSSFIYSNFCYTITLNVLKVFNEILF